MIVQCVNCGFTVSESMKFAIKTNSCPSCGTHLFSDDDMQIIQSFQNELSNQSFTFNFTEQILHDLALFMFHQAKHGLIRELIKQELNRDKTPPDEGSLDDEKIKLRQEIEAEYKEEISEIVAETPEIPQTDDIISKAERLRRLAQQRQTSGPVKVAGGGIGKTGASVRRSDG